MKSDRRIDAAFLAVLFVLGASVALRPLVAGDDLWAHAAAGRWMLQNHTIPRTNLFLWSAPNFPWIAHSWLSQVLFASALSLGVAAILALNLLLCFAPFALLWRAARKRNAAMMACFVIGVFAAMPRFDPRPELLSASCLVLLLLLLWAAQPRQSWLVALLFAAWANFHGAVALGLVLVWATAFASFTQWLVQRKTGIASVTRMRTLFLFALTGTVATLFNPYGVQLWRALVPIQSQTFAMLDEWRPLFAQPSMPLFYIGAEVSLAVAALVFWARNPRRDWAHLAWLLLMGAAFVQARRQLWLFALVALAVIVFNAPESEENYEKAEIRRRLTLAGLFPLAAAWCFVAMSASGLGRGLLASDVPRGAIEVVRERGRRVFNGYSISSYAQWALAGKPALHIDLLNAYPDSVLRDALDMSQANMRGRALLHNQHIDCVLLARGDAKPLARYLNQSEQWQRVYDKSDGVVWLHKSTVEFDRTAAN
ncbi:MAG TPA: hypothetical protein VF681_02465 [Abditibacteriaceae bacterium]